MMLTANIWYAFMFFAEITTVLFSWNKEHTVNLEHITEMSEYVEQVRSLIL